MREKTIWSPTGSSCIKVSTIGALRISEAGPGISIIVYDIFLKEKMTLSARGGVEEARKWVKDACFLMEREEDTDLVRHKRMIRIENEDDGIDRINE